MPRHYTIFCELFSAMRVTLKSRETLFCWGFVTRGSLGQFLGVLLGRLWAAHQGPRNARPGPCELTSFVLAEFCEPVESRAASGGSRMPAQPPLLPVFAPVTETPARERTLAHLHPSGPARSKKTSLTVSGPKGTGQECEQRLIYPTSPARGTDGPASQTSVPRSEWRDSNGA